MTKSEQKRFEKEFDWLSKNMKKLQGRYPGKWIAVANNKITGVGKTAKEAYSRSIKLYPKIEPLLDVVPTKECLFL